MTKQELQDFRMFMMKIRQHEEMLIELRNRAVNISPSSGDTIRSTKDEDKIAKAVAAIIDTENLITDKMEEAYQRINHIEEAISILPEREQLLIRYRYIRGLKWEKICIEMDYSWKQIHRIHSIALKLLEKNNHDT